MPYLAGGHSDCQGSFSQGMEVDFQRSCAIEGSQGTHAVARTCKQGSEIGLRHEFFIALKLSRCSKDDADMTGFRLRHLERNGDGLETLDREQIRPPAARA